MQSLVDAAHQTTRAIQDELAALRYTLMHPPEPSFTTTFLFGATLVAAGTTLIGAFLLVREIRRATTLPTYYYRCPECGDYAAANVEGQCLACGSEVTQVYEERG